MMDEELIRKVDEHGDFLKMDDGFIHFYPSIPAGAFAAHELRIIADELDRRNKDWKDKVEKELGTLSMKLTLHNPPDGFEAKAEYRVPHKDEWYLPILGHSSPLQSTWGLSHQRIILKKKNAWRTPRSEDDGKLCRVRDHVEDEWIVGRYVGRTPQGDYIVCISGRHYLKRCSICEVQE